MQFHEKITSLRKEKGWKQEETAEMLQMSLHGYANIERGETDPRKSRIEQLAQLFGVEPKDLMDTEGKNVLNNILSEECSFSNCFNSSNKNLEYELEKSQLIVEQQAKEIAYLKEIIELMKKNV